MTTAHRPTFDPARGKEAQRGPAYHQRLLPAHTHLKYRQAGQGGAGGLSTNTEQRGDLQDELLRAEAAVKARKGSCAAGAIEDGDADAVADADDTEGGTKRKIDDDEADTARGEDEDPETKRRRLILEEARDIDADSEGSGSSSESETEDEDDEDEEAELMRELAKIKAERAAAKAAEEEAREKEEEEKREVDIAKGNPLMNKPDFGVKRRWDDDVVFRNQARGTEERGKRKEFVNDLLRSDFHRRFMVCVSIALVSTKRSF